MARVDKSFFTSATFNNWVIRSADQLHKSWSELETGPPDRSGDSLREIIRGHATAVLSDKRCTSYRSGRITVCIDHMDDLVASVDADVLAAEDWER